MAKAREKPPATTHQLVWVTWRDAVNQSARIHADDWANVSIVQNKNLGWIVDQNADRLLLCHGVSSSGEFDCFAIPTENVVAVEPLVKKRTKVTIEAKH